MQMSRPVLVWLSTLALLGSATALQAAPPEGRGAQAGPHPRQQEMRGPHGQVREERLHRQAQPGHGPMAGRAESERRERLNLSRDATPAQRAEHGRIRELIEAHRPHWSAQPALPPGIRKNLQRGKPLPPGIGKWLEPELRRSLPQYTGYEWLRAGSDLLLVSTASGLIDQVLRDAFLRR